MGHPEVEIVRQLASSDLPHTPAETLRPPPCAYRSASMAQLRLQGVTVAAVHVTSGIKPCAPEPRAEPWLGTCIVMRAPAAACHRHAGRLRECLARVEG